MFGEMEHNEDYEERERSFTAGGKSCADSALVILLVTIGIILLVLLLLSARR